MNVNEKESFNGNGAFNETDSYIKNFRINYLVEILPKALLFLIKAFLFLIYKINIEIVSLFRFSAGDLNQHDNMST